MAPERGKRAPSVIVEASWATFSRPGGLGDCGGQVEELQRRESHSSDGAAAARCTIDSEYGNCGDDEEGECSPPAVGDSDLTFYSQRLQRATI